MTSDNSGRTTVTALVLGVFCSIFLPAALSAQENSLSVTVTPPLIQLSIGPGESWTSALKVVNSNSFDVAYYAQVVNFEPDGEGGASRFTPVVDGETSYSLAGWVTVPSDPIVVPAGQSAEIPFRVRVPGDASPGGHYAAILVGTQPGKADSAGASMSVSSFVSSLLFVRIQGDVQEDGRIREFRSVQSWYEQFIANFILRFENTGNTHLRPQGDITFYNMWGKERGKLVINQTSNFGNVLPKSTRRFEFRWEGEQSAFDIGRYSAIVTLAYGEDSKKNVSATAFFWVVPTVPVAFAVGSVIFFLALMSWFMRRYIRRAISLERQRFGETRMPETTPSIGTLVEPLREGAIDLRSLMSQKRDEATSTGLSQQGASSGGPVPALTLGQFVTKYKIFLFFVGFLVAGSVGTWIYLDRALESERQFVITDVTAREEKQ